MDWKVEVRRLLSVAGPGLMRPAAYDTAWFARLHTLNVPYADKAVEWLRTHQLEDGSWGASELYYAHDRIISTLAAITALAHLGDAADEPRIQRARGGLLTALDQLEQHPEWETAAFEMLAPMLLKESMRFGVPDVQSKKLQRMIAQRDRKMAGLAGRQIDRTIPLSFSAEMAGRHTDMLNLDRLQALDGSVAYSPSATAYYYLQCRQDQTALNYLHHLAQRGDGAMPNVYPFAVFERAWTLWNLALTNDLDDELLTLCRPLLDALEAAWEPGKGVSYNDHYIPDGDDTSLTFEALHMYGRTPDFDAVMYHYVGKHFRCNILESNISISTNAHALGALRAAGRPLSAAPVQDVLAYLQKSKTSAGYWLDKWHASPYYATCHAIIAAAGYADDLVEPAVAWLHASQHPHGAWGAYLPTREETAYCLQALAVWRRHGGEVDHQVMRRGAAWLTENQHQPDPPLWIGKCLYAPTLVIHSAVLSALRLAAQINGGS